MRADADRALALAHLDVEAELALVGDLAQRGADRARRPLGDGGDVLDADLEADGGLALVVGHSNTVPEIVRSLTGSDAVPPIGEEEFDTLYVVSVPTIGKASVLRMKY